MAGDNVAHLLAARDVGVENSAEVAVKFGAAAFGLGLDLRGEIGAFLAVERDQGLAERQLPALVTRKPGGEVAAGFGDAVGEAGRIERRLGGAGAGMRPATKAASPASATRPNTMRGESRS